jgi:fibronectin type 3 domain-containing protein
VTQNAIELSWQVPQLASASNGGGVTAYHVYRGELDASAPVPASDLSQAKWKNAPLLLAPAQRNSYSDAFFEFGKTYAYFVRSVAIADGNPIESDDSAPAIVTPRDTFPPGVPQNVVAAVLQGTEDTRLVDLSWSINADADLVGYRIYRSEKEGERGALLQTELLASPAYHDSSVTTGHRYWYSVTAVDRAGNESGTSDAALADLTQPMP